MVAGPPHWPGGSAGRSIGRIDRLQRLASALTWFTITWLPFLVPPTLLVLFGILLLRRNGFFQPRPPITEWPPRD